MRAGLHVPSIYLVIYILLGFWDLSLEDSRGKVSSFSWQLCIPFEDYIVPSVDHQVPGTESHRLLLLLLLFSC